MCSRLRQRHPMDMYVVCKVPTPIRSLITTLQTKCTLLLVKIPLAGWQCTSRVLPLIERANITLRNSRLRSSGFGTSMTNSQMVIMWPNKDGSVTVSQRKASSHTQPQVDRAPQRTAQTHLAISAVSSCVSYIFKNKPFDAWRILLFIMRATISSNTLGILLPDDDLT